jgi:hypothetical protein
VFEKCSLLGKQCLPSQANWIDLFKQALKESDTKRIWYNYTVSVLSQSTFVCYGHRKVLEKFEYMSGCKQHLCQPYKLFSLCSYCGSARWSPVEDARRGELRLWALCIAQRSIVLRLVGMCVAAVIMVIVGTVMLGVIHSLLGAGDELSSL